MQTFDFHVANVKAVGQRLDLAYESFLLSMGLLELVSQLDGALVGPPELRGPGLMLRLVVVEISALGSAGHLGIEVL